MTLAYDKDISEPAAQLAAAAPREWEAFKQAFGAYVSARRDQLVLASLEEMPRCQGRAQTSSQLAKLFEDAVPASNEAFEKRRNASR